MNFEENQRKSMKIYENAWTSMKNEENQRKPMNI